MKEYSIEGLSKNLEKIFPNNVDRLKTPNQKKKVVFVNVFYSPQNIGGATRIFEANISRLLERYGDEYEISVFTTDAYTHTEYDLTEFMFNGVKVTKLHLPIIHYFEWNSKNDIAEHIFSEYLQKENPDFINFHCIQRMTGSVVDAAIELGIPYFITVHDAWWLSDFQFLMNEDDELCTMEQMNPFVAESRVDIDREASLKRKMHLKSLLDNAVKVISVSSAFEKIYRLNGVGNTVVCQNGISPSFLTKLRERNRRGGRTVIGLIGGMSAHKGYNLLMDILDDHSFPNLSFLVVDHAHNSSYTMDSSNDLNEIKVIGKVPQDEVHELYNSIDVLAAPSLWPESYGLVTREALAYGLWVIASNLGAIGEDVTQGENGFVVDVSDTLELQAVLEQINSSHEIYQESPDFAYKPRTINDQVNDLVDIFKVGMINENK